MALRPWLMPRSTPPPLRRPTARRSRSQRLRRRRSRRQLAAARRPAPPISRRWAGTPRARAARAGSTRSATGPKSRGSLSCTPPNLGFGLLGREAPDGDGPGTGDGGRHQLDPGVAVRQRDLVAGGVEEVRGLAEALTGAPPCSGDAVPQPADHCGTLAEELGHRLLRAPRVIEQPPH